MYTHICIYYTVYVYTIYVYTIYVYTIYVYTIYVYTIYVCVYTYVFSILIRIDIDFNLHAMQAESMKAIPLCFDGLL